MSGFQRHPDLRGLRPASLRGIKKTNEYQTRISQRLYDEIPKAVFAAIAVSYADLLGLDPEELDNDLAAEWDILNANGIVQPVTARARKFIRKAAQS